MSISSWLFSTDPFVPHGFCLLWRPDLIWTHVIADAVIGISYFTIPLFLVTLTRRRKDLVFSKAFVAAATFIVLCGTGHFISLVSFWIPIYGIEAVVKVGTALASIATAIAVWTLLPKILAIPSPSDLKKLNTELESRVRDRTHELATANRSLELLLRELHHRVKNNLQIVISLLSLKQRNSSAQSAGEAMARTIARVHAMSLVHELLHRGVNLADLKFSLYLERLVAHLRDESADATPEIEIDADDSEFDLDQSVPLALAANEMLSTALRHRASDAGRRIRVVVRTDGSKGKLEIHDNGAGERDMSGDGLTLRIVDGLALQLGGKASASSAPDGWIFTLVFERTQRVKERMAAALAPPASCAA